MMTLLLDNFLSWCLCESHVFLLVLTSNWMTSRVVEILRSKEEKGLLQVEKSKCWIYCHDASI